MYVSRPDDLPETSERGSSGLESSEHTGIETMKKTKSAFTLVELMIVVALIALVASIAIPNFFEARKRAQETKVIGWMNLFPAAQEQFKNRFQVYVGGSVYEGNGSAKDIALGDEELIAVNVLNSPTGNFEPLATLSTPVPYYGYNFSIQAGGDRTPAGPFVDPVSGYVYQTYTNTPPTDPAVDTADTWFAYAYPTINRTVGDGVYFIDGSGLIRFEPDNPVGDGEVAGPGSQPLGSR